MNNNNGAYHNSVALLNNNQNYPSTRITGQIVDKNNIEHDPSKLFHNESKGFLILSPPVNKK